MSTGLRPGEILAMEPPVRIDDAIEQMTTRKQYVRHDSLLLGGGQISYCIYRSGLTRVVSPRGLEPVIQGQDLIGFRLISKHSSE